MYFAARRSQLVTAAHFVALILAVAFFSGLQVAALFASSAYVGYLNAFAVFRSLLFVMRGRTVSRITVGLIVIASIGSLVLGWLGQWQALAIVTFGFFIIDAVVLRFQVAPVGTKASAA